MHNRRDIALQRTRQTARIWTGRCLWFEYRDYPWKRLIVFHILSSYQCSNTRIKYILLSLHTPLVSHDNIEKKKKQIDKMKKIIENYEKGTFSRMFQCVVKIELPVNWRHANQFAFSPSLFQRRGELFIKKNSMSLMRIFRRIGKRFMVGFIFIKYREIRDFWVLTSRYKH